MTRQHRIMLLTLFEKIKQVLVEENNSRRELTNLLIEMEKFLGVHNNRKRPSKEDQQLIMEFYDANVPLKVIQETFSISNAYISRIRRKQGLPGRNNYPPTREAPLRK